MKHVAIIGKDSEKVSDLKEKLKKEGFIISTENPSLVICHGGDGTFLIAERTYPGVLKILIKGSKISNKGHELPIDEIIKRYLEGKYSVEEIRKLRAVSGKHELIGVNDIVIRNSLPTEAIRFILKIDGKRVEDEIVGDGVIISTPYGSTAYFNSVTREKFDKGIAIAFNNTTNKIAPIYLNGDEKIEIEITRGPAVLISDNNRYFIHLEKGDKVKIELSDLVAKRIVIE